MSTNYWLFGPREEKRAFRGQRLAPADAALDNARFHSINRQERKRPRYSGDRFEQQLKEKQLLAPAPNQHVVYPSDNIQWPTWPVVVSTPPPQQPSEPAPVATTQEDKQPESAPPPPSMPEPPPPSMPMDPAERPVPVVTEPEAIETPPINIDETFTAVAPEFFAELVKNSTNPIGIPIYPIILPSQVPEPLQPFVQNQSISLPTRPVLPMSTEPMSVPRNNTAWDVTDLTTPHSPLNYVAEFMVELFKINNQNGMPMQQNFANFNNMCRVLRESIAVGIFNATTEFTTYVQTGDAPARESWARVNEMTKKPVEVESTGDKLVKDRDSIITPQETVYEEDPAVYKLVRSVYNAFAYASGEVVLPAAQTVKGGAGTALYTIADWSRWGANSLVDVGGEVVIPAVKTTAGFSGRAIYKLTRIAYNVVIYEGKEVVIPAARFFGGLTGKALYKAVEITSPYASAAFDKTLQVGGDIAAAALDVGLYRTIGEITSPYASAAFDKTLQVGGDIAAAAFDKTLQVGGDIVAAALDVGLYRTIGGTIAYVQDMMAIHVNVSEMVSLLTTVVKGPELTSQTRSYDEFATCSANLRFFERVVEYTRNVYESTAAYLQVFSNTIREIPNIPFKLPKLIRALDDYTGTTETLSWLKLKGDLYFAERFPEHFPDYQQAKESVKLFPKPDDQYMGELAQRMQDFLGGFTGTIRKEQLQESLRLAESGAPVDRVIEALQFAKTVTLPMYGPPITTMANLSAFVAQSATPMQFNETIQAYHTKFDKMSFASPQQFKETIQAHQTKFNEMSGALTTPDDDWDIKNNIDWTSIFWPESVWEVHLNSKLARGRRNLLLPPVPGWVRGIPKAAVAAAPTVLVAGLSLATGIMFKNLRAMQVVNTVLRTQLIESRAAQAVAVQVATAAVGQLVLSNVENAALQVQLRATQERATTNQDTARGLLGMLLWLWMTLTGPVNVGALSALPASKQPPPPMAYPIQALA